MPRVVGVHGIAQQFRGGPELTRSWSDALRGGLEAADFRQVADGIRDRDVRVVFFGDLFRRAGAMAAGDPPYTAADIHPGPERDLLLALYDEAVAVQPELGPPTGAMGPGKAAVQVMADRLLKSKTFARVAQRAFFGNLKQVTAFLTDPAVKQRVLDRVDAEITEDTTVLIGHSLGSIVTYEYLTRYKPAQIRLHMTIGSPLGIRNLVFDKLTPTPAQGAGVWPGRLPAWHNIADTDDIVALTKHLNPLFPPPPTAEAPAATTASEGIRRAQQTITGIVDQLVDNGDEPHSITRYLNAAPTGEAAGPVLAAS